MMQFGDRLTQGVLAVSSPTCVGLDPHLNRLPEPLVRGLTPGGDAALWAEAVERFCLGAIRAVAGQVPAVKPQAAFFEQLGSPGVAVLERVCRTAQAAGLLVILDVKRGDIGSTAEAYARGTLDDDGPMGVDAVTLSPYLGAESLGPFLARADRGKGLFVLVRTSNPGSEAWQGPGEAGIAGRVADWIREENQARRADEAFGPLGAVVGATLPDEAGIWRARMPHAWFLVPGFGAQGATAEDVRQHAGPDHLGALITSSRGVLFPKSGREGEDWEQGIKLRCAQLTADVRSVLPVGR